MSKNKLFIVFSLITIICVFSIAAIANQCGFPTYITKESKDTEEVVNSEDEKEDILHREESSSEEKSSEKNQEGSLEKETPPEEEHSNEAVSAEAPTITLEVYEGPIYSSSDGICYYRVKAIVSGNPIPDVEFSKDDSNGAWGEYIAQVNLNNSSENYLLNATVINSEGAASSSIALKWECTEQETKVQESSISNNETIEYFYEIAFGSEYGSSLPLLHKWKDDVRIKVNGTPTSADLDTLHQVANELSSLLNSISLITVDQNQNIDIYFTTLDQFPLILSSYVQGNMGFFNVWWDSSGYMYTAKILIASEGLSQQERSHLIREELTQSLGLMKDSNRYEDSIFFQGWTNTISYTSIDREIITLLYDNRLKPNMTKEQVKETLGIP